MKSKFWWTLRNGNYIIPAYASDRRKGVKENFEKQNTRPLESYPHLTIVKIEISRVA